MIVQAGRPITADGVRFAAGDIATKIRNSLVDAENFRRQLESWTDEDLMALGLSQEQINAFKGFYVHEVPTLVQALLASTWVRQMLGVGVPVVLIPPPPFTL